MPQPTPGNSAIPARLPAGEYQVGAPVSCVLTRFGLRRKRYLLPTYRDYRRVARAARRAQVPGLLYSAFLVENLTTCYTLSLWVDSDDAISTFGSDVGVHVKVARRVFGRLAFELDRGPELCSTKWRLATVSNNLNWGDLELRSRLGELRPERGPHDGG